MRTTFFLLKKTNKAGNPEILVCLNGENSVRLVDLPTGINFLGGQQLHVSRIGKDTWINQVNGRMFIGDPGTYFGGFDKGLAALQVLCVRVVTEERPADASFVYYPVPRFCNVGETAREFFLKDDVGPYRTSLTQWIRQNISGQHTVELPNDPRFSLPAVLSGTKLTLWGCPGVILMAGGLRSMAAQYCRELEIDVAKIWMKTDRQPLLSNPMLEGIPPTVLEESLFL